MRLQEAPACLPGKPRPDASGEEIMNIITTALLRFHGDQLPLHPQVTTRRSAVAEPVLSCSPRGSRKQVGPVVLEGGVRVHTDLPLL